MALTLDSTVALSNGTAIPRLGLGVYQIPDGEPTFNAVTWALEVGYRHIDTAKMYENEPSVGRAVRESGVPRESIWVTTKLWPTDFLHVQAAFDASLRRLGLEYVDLYLVHFPVPGLTGSVWKRMEAIAASGRARAIGVSNYRASQLGALVRHAEVPPVVNQVRASAFGYNRRTYEECHREHVAFEAYSPLTRGKRLSAEPVVQIAERHGKSTAQVVLRWALQKDMVAIPKSQHRARIAENAELFDFELDAADLEVLDRLSE